MAFLLADKVTVELIGLPLALKVSEFGLITQLSPVLEEATEHPRPTLPVRPFKDFTVIVNKGPCCPEEMLCEGGVAVMVKSPTPY